MRLAFGVFSRSLRLMYQNIWPLLWLSALWVVVSVPLVTLPPATAALYASVHQLVAGRDVPVRAYFAAFRQYFIRGWLLAALDALWLGGAAYGTLFYLNQAGALQFVVAVPMYMLLFGVMLQPYLFPLLIAQQDKSIRLVFRNAIVLLVRQPLFTVTVSVMLAAWTFIAVVLNGPLLLIAVSASAFLQCLALQAVLPLVIPPQLKTGDAPASPEDTSADPNQP